MSTLFEYLLYVTAFIAVVLAVEGIGRLVRSAVGEERAIGKRLAKARAAASVTAQAATELRADPISQALKARLPWLERALIRADAPFSALQLLLSATVLFIVVFAALSFALAPRLIALAAATTVAVGAPVVVVSTLTSHRRKRFLDQLPQAVDLIARSLQAGHPVTSAMAVVGQRMPAPLGPEFRLVIEEMTYGLDRDAAMENLVRRFPVPELRMFVASLEVTRESGGNLAEVFLKLAASIRAKDHLRRKVHAISSEGRMTFWVVSGLPLVMGSAIMLIRPAFFLDVYKDPLFWPMISFAPISLAIGATMIWRMVNFKI
jgi:tight adherence protein B